MAQVDSKSVTELCEQARALMDEERAITNSIKARAVLMEAYLKIRTVEELCEVALTTNTVFDDVEAAKQNLRQAEKFPDNRTEDFDVISKAYDELGDKEGVERCMELATKAN